MAPTEHLKMMRLLFLCLLLMLPAATAVSKDIEGSADEDLDDEDFEQTEIPKLGAAADKNTGLKEEQTITTIVIIVAVVALALSVAVIVAIVLVRRHKYNRQQGIYSVPTEQDQKGAV
ncbi:uncharacterized protein si:dkey-262k9.2 isoform X2 [Perca fluviatilis]|uniref:uncharacterized protein si:dkey-262k9.2 isoform X2 n=1 Tax=Perca fluviatilis TaxID=8168 RepID=UPI0019659B4E|nr:uncharacterized protein si:dkey-262k9.2 isoform X2 [Perca fluviatilis]